MGFVMKKKRNAYEEFNISAFQYKFFFSYNAICDLSTWKDFSCKLKVESKTPDPFIG